MRKIAIVGKGNVGSHLYKMMRARQLETDLIDSRHPVIDGKAYDLVMLTVSDRAIEPMAANLSEILQDYSGIVVHTSGTVPMKVLAPYFRNVGVFYPLQTFSKEVPIENYEEIPIFIEGNSEKTSKELGTLASHITKEWGEYTSEKREKLHLASVFSCNFVNAMYSIASDILESNGIPYSMAYPLMKQTLTKALNGNPKECQTGPARRADMLTVDRHIKELEKSDLMLAKIYKDISAYIMQQKNEQD